MNNFLKPFSRRIFSVFLCVVMIVTMIPNDGVKTASAYAATELATSTISGTVFVDENNNRVMDKKEKGLAGVTVTATDSQESVQHTVTDANGEYHFTQVRNDDITIKVEVGNDDDYRFIAEPLSEKDIPKNTIANQVTPDESGKSASAVIKNCGEEESISAAVGKVKVYKLTYNGGSQSTGLVPQQKEYPSGTQVTVAAAPSGMGKPGYRFLGWATKSDAATPEYQPGDVVDMTSDVTLYALWEATTINLYFDYQGASNPGFTSKKVLYGNALGEAQDGLTWPCCEVSGNSNGETLVPKKEGYQFWKWEVADTEIVGAGKEVNKSTICEFTKDTEVRAVFTRLKEDKGSFTIPFGTGTKEKPLLDLNRKVSIENDAVVPEDGASVKYEVTSGSLPEGLTLTEDGKITGTPKVEMNKTSAPITIKVTGRNGKEFKYVFDLTFTPRPIDIVVTAEPEGGVLLAYESGDDGRKNYIATEVAIKVQINNLASGVPLCDKTKMAVLVYEVDSNTEASQPIKYDSSSMNFDADGNIKILWQNEAGNKGRYDVTFEIDGKVNPCYVIRNNQGVINYVISCNQEGFKSHTIQFDLNGAPGDAPKDKAVVICDGCKYGELPIPSWSGHEFLGWSTVNDDYDAHKELQKAVVSGTAIESESPKTFNLYAQWKPIEYTVNYVVEGHDKISIPPKKVIYQVETVKETETLTETEKEKAEKAQAEAKEKAKLTLTETEKEKVKVPEGYELGSYYYGSTKVEPDTMYSELAGDDSVKEITITVTLDPKKYFVTYDPNGGSLSSEGFRATYDKAYGALATPSKNGYDFVKWVDEDGESKEISATSIYEKTEDSTIKAQWTPKKGFTVKYNTDGGSEVEPKKDVAWNQSGLLTDVVPTKPGFTFVKWTYNDKDVSDDQTYSEFAVQDNVTTLTFKAVWEPKPIRVVFHENPLEGDNVILSYTAQDCTFGGFYFKFPTVNKSTSDLVGWYTKAKDGEQRYITSSVSEEDVTVEKDSNSNYYGIVDLYAHWSTEITIAGKIDMDYREPDTSQPVPAENRPDNVKLELLRREAGTGNGYQSFSEFTDMDDLEDQKLTLDLDGKKNEKLEKESIEYAFKIPHAIGYEYKVVAKIDGYDMVVPTVSDSNDANYPYQGINKKTQNLNFSFKYIPQKFNMQFDVKVDNENVPATKASIIQPVAVNVKAVYATDNKNTDPTSNAWKTIIQHTNQTVKVPINDSGEGSGSYDVWKYQLNGAPYYYHIIVDSYELSDGTIVKVDEGLYSETYGTDLAYYKDDNDKSDAPNVTLTYFGKEVSFNIDNVNTASGKTDYADSIPHDSIVVRPGTTIEKPEIYDEDENGYQITGWYTDPEFKDPYYFEDPIPNDITSLYSKWQSKQTIKTEIMSEPGALQVESGISSTVYKKLSELHWSSVVKKNTDVPVSDFYSKLESNADGFKGEIDIQFVSKIATNAAIVQELDSAVTQKGIDYKAGMYGDFTVHLRTSVSENGVTKNSETLITDTKNVILVKVKMPEKVQNKDSYVMFRKHGTEAVKSIPELEGTNRDESKAPTDEDGKEIEGFYVKGAYCYIWAHDFSEYVLGYKETSGNGGGNGSSGGGNGGGDVVAPVTEPSMTPPVTPSETPSATPTAVPSETPTLVPTVVPTQAPTTTEPTVNPSSTPKPTTEPSTKPTPTKTPEKGTTVTDKKGTDYKVVSTGKTPTVAYKEPAKDIKGTVSIPSTTKVNGATYKVTEIASNAFKNETKITKIKTGDNVKKIDDGAFSGCTNLKTISLGKNVASLGDKTFANCKSLTAVSLPSSVTKIGTKAFAGCEKLKTITIKSTKLTAKNIAKNAFAGISKNTVIKVPASKYKKYVKLLCEKGLSKKVKIKKI